MEGRKGRKGGKKKASFFYVKIGDVLRYWYILYIELGGLSQVCSIYNNILRYLFMICAFFLYSYHTLNKKGPLWNLNC